jgi:hypothetical protein
MRVRQSRAGRGSPKRSGCFKYFRAVLRSIPLFIALNVVLIRIFR